MSRYENYRSNLNVLRRAPEQDLTDEFVLCGIIRIFVIQFELAWRLLRETLEHADRLQNTINAPRGIIQAAASTYDFIDEDLWLAMLDDRNAAEHVYDEKMAERLVDSILTCYIAAFEDLLSNIQKTYSSELLATF